MYFYVRHTYSKFHFHYDTTIKIFLFFFLFVCLSSEHGRTNFLPLLFIYIYIYVYIYIYIYITYSLFLTIYNTVLCTLWFYIVNRWSLRDSYNRSSALLENKSRTVFLGSSYVYAFVCSASTIRRTSFSNRSISSRPISFEIFKTEGIAGNRE